MPVVHSRLQAVVLFLALVATSAAKTDYTHATVGNLDVVSSMSRERTTRFLHELVGIRLIIEDLLGTPARQAATQVVVFSSQEEMNEFYPEQKTYSRYLSTDITTTFSKKWVCSTAQEGDTFSIVNEWPNDRRFREGALESHAAFLISYSLPNCPHWIYRGLAQVLCTLEYHDGQARIGTSIIKQEGISLAKRIPLTDTLVRDHNSADIAGLWRMWLTEDYDGNRAKIRKLADLVRHGARGDAATVSEAFGQPIGEIQRALYKHMRRLTDATVDRPALTQSLLARVEFLPATELEMTVARGTVVALAKAGSLGVDASLRTLVEQYPHSPRPWEALAGLMAANNEPGSANEYWLKALKRGTHNTYAHILALRQRLEPRINEINLRPSLPPSLTEELRGLVDQSLVLNPGLFEALDWSAWIEALAPQPETARIETATNSSARYIRPTMFIPLIVANLRLRHLDEASRLLDEYEKLPGRNGNNQTVLAFLRARVGAARGASN